MRTSTLIDDRTTARLPTGQPTWLHLVTAPELERLRDEMAKGCVPPDLEEKLARLATGGLSHRFIEQHCRTMIPLLQAAEAGVFTEISPSERDRLLRVLAYVRKDDDAIPDYRPDGFLDDQQEVRLATTELGPLLQAFKAWRLRHQVPGMWFRNRLPASGRTAPSQANLGSPAAQALEFAPKRDRGLVKPCTVQT